MLDAVPEDLGHEIADALAVLLRRSVRSSLYRELTEGVGPGVDELTYPVLSGLARTGPCSAAELAVEIGLDRSGVSRRASRLEAEGLVRREPDPRDARAILLVLTRTGSDVVEITRGRLADRIATDLSSWPEEQAQAFAAGLRHFVEQGPFSPRGAEER